jgi:hypothetical protein
MVYISLKKQIFFSRYIFHVHKRNNELNLLEGFIRTVHFVHIYSHESLPRVFQVSNQYCHKGATQGPDTQTP